MPEVALLVLRCRDLEAARRVYSALGLTFVAEQHGDGPRHLAATTAAGTVLELYPLTAGDTPVARGSAADIRIGLAVPDVPAAIDAALIAGATLVSPIDQDGGRAVLADPDGRRVEVLRC